MAQISTALPAALAREIALNLDGRSRLDLRERASRISERYRSGQPTRAAVASAEDALAYALTRLPATYAASVTALARFSAENPAFAPKRVLDLGCGLGAGAFAALEVWPNIAEVVLLDRSREFLVLAKDFCAASEHPALAAAAIVEADFSAFPRLDGAFDLVIVAYALTELEEAPRAALLSTIWSLEPQALALIEPGSPRDWRRLMTSRAQLVAAGAHIAFPCPHDRACPLEEPDWCHFAARLARSRDHKFLKNADVPYEDEKFSALVARPGPRPAAAKARVLRPPLIRKWGLDLKLCTPQAADEVAILKREKARYDLLRKISWGDSADAPD